MQLFKDGVMNRETAAQLLKSGIQLPRPLADEYKAACGETEDSAKSERERLREKLRQQLN